MITPALVPLVVSLALAAEPLAGAAAGTAGEPAAVAAGPIGEPGAGAGAAAGEAVPRTPEIARAAPNRPPALDEQDDYDPPEPGERLSLRLWAEDPDGDDITFTASDLPRGAHLVPQELHRKKQPDGSEPSRKSVLVEWTPSDAQAGTTSSFSVTASDGRLSTSRRYVASAARAVWESYLMPGLRASLWQPRGQSTYGRFTGVSAEFLVASWVHRNENRGPSHGRVYVNLDLLASDRDGVSNAFSYTLGADLSFERNPHRRYLIPYFGLEMGGLVQKQIGSFFQTTPLGGLFLYSGRNLAVTAAAGYLLPVSRDVGDLQGLRAKLGVDFSLW